MDVIGTFWRATTTELIQIVWLDDATRFQNEPQYYVRVTQEA